MPPSQSPSTFPVSSHKRYVMPHQNPINPQPHSLGHSPCGFSPSQVEGMRCAPAMEPNTRNATPNQSSHPRSSGFPLSWHNLVSGPSLQLAPVASMKMPSSLTVTRGRGKEKNGGTVAPEPLQSGVPPPEPYGQSLGGSGLAF